MDVSIQERKFSFVSEYDISAPDSSYYARKALFSLTDKLQLKTQAGEIVARIRGLISPLRNRHDFFLQDGRVYHFRCQKLWTRVFVCEGDNETFRLFEHKGLRYSIFHNDRQIAAFVKNRVVFGSGNQYKIRIDSDADSIVILCLVLTINSAEYDDDDSSVTIDFGNVGPEGKKFDESWQPR